MTVTLTIPDTQAARLATVLRARGAAGVADADVIRDFFVTLAQAEVRAIRKQTLDEQITTEETKPTPDDTVLGGLLLQQRRL